MKNKNTVPTSVNIPAVGDIMLDSGMKPLQRCSDNVFEVGKDSVASITATGDGKVEFIAFEDHTLAYVIRIEKPIKAVLMDLDGTSVKSENFWIWIIQQTTASLLGEPAFQLEEVDMPYVSGHSVSEHLQHCISKYCPDKTVEEARKYYFEHTHRWLK
ncbi:MAG: HAD family hydrolase [Planctomycetota bacterium]|jgi:hypothetical protein